MPTAKICAENNAFGDAAWSTNVEGFGFQTSFFFFSFFFFSSQGIVDYPCCDECYMFEDSTY